MLRDEFDKWFETQLNHILIDKVLPKLLNDNEFSLSSRKRPGRCHAHTGPFCAKIIHESKPESPLRVAQLLKEQGAEPPFLAPS